MRLFGNGKPRNPPTQVIEGTAHVGNGPFYPMQSYNGMTIPNRARNNGQDIDTTPVMFRRYFNTGAHDVQLHNGLANGVAAGKLTTWVPTGQAVIAHIPGQTRDNVGGFHKRGMGPYNYQDMVQSTAGSQPEHPGGPGQIAGTPLYNPMTG